MLVVIGNHKWELQSLLTMVQIIQNAREWDVNNQEFLHIVSVMLKFLLQRGVCQQVFHTDPQLIYGGGVNKKSPTDVRLSSDKKMIDPQREEFSIFFRAS